MSDDETLGQRIGGFIFGIPLVFCSMEMVPGWGIFNLNWPNGYFYAIMAVCGSLAGMLMSSYRIPGLAGGLLAGYGALFAVGKVLENVNVIHNGVLVLVALIGVLPGVALYWAMRYPLQKMREARETVAEITDFEEPAELIDFVDQPVEDY